MFWNRLINKGFGKGLIAIFSILLCIAVFFLGCGRKAPPVPPGQARPPAVDDLSSSIDGNMLKLSWTIPDEKGRSHQALVIPTKVGIQYFLATSALLDSRLRGNDGHLCDIT